MSVFVYEVGTGDFFVLQAGSNQLFKLERGYSGSQSKGKKNDVSAESHIGAGPIPRGLWFVETRRETPTPASWPLRFVEGSGGARGRTGIMVHGDSRAAPGDASIGCIILTRSTREKLRRGDVIFAI